MHRSSFLALAIAGGLTVQAPPSVERGKAIYRTGLADPATPISAALDGDRDEVPASLLPCVNCHGEDGLGKPEADVSPPDIRWQTLTKPYPVARPNGRTSPPYTERTLVRAITLGLDPAGTRLARAMPRYRLSQRDAADLVAYLATIGGAVDPGLTSSAITIGVMLPPHADRGSGGPALAVERALTAYFKDINERGGLYNRRIEVRFADGAGPDGLARLRADAPFAIAASALAGIEDEVVRFVSESGVPVVGAVTLDPRPDPATPIFYADGGLPGQAESLAAFAAKRQPQGRLVIVYSSAAVSRRSADAAMRVARDAGWTAEAIELTRVHDPRGQAALQAADGVIFVSLEGSTVDFLRQAAAAAPRTALLVPGPLTARDVFTLPSELDGRLFVAFSTLPSDRAAREVAEYERLIAAHSLSRDHMSDQLAALSSARVLITALQRAGQQLSRQRLIAAVESLRDFSTGLSPPLTYTPSRRIGVTGAHIVTIDLKSGTGVPKSVWVEPR